MQELHHSDVLSYAISRIASDYMHDKNALIEDLKQRTREASHRGLGTTQHLLPDDLFDKVVPSDITVEKEGTPDAYKETLPHA